MAKLHIDENDRVRCPRRGDLDIDRCVDCPDFRGIRGDGDRIALLCSVPEPLAAADGWALAELTWEQPPVPR